MPDRRAVTVFLKKKKKKKLSPRCVAESFAAPAYLSAGVSPGLGSVRECPLCPAASLLCSPRQRSPSQRPSEALGSPPKLGCSGALHRGLCSRPLAPVISRSRPENPLTPVPPLPAAGAPLTPSEDSAPFIFAGVSSQRPRPPTADSGGLNRSVHASRTAAAAGPRCGPRAHFCAQKGANGQGLPQASRPRRNCFNLFFAARTNTAYLLATLDGIQRSG